MNACAMVNARGWGGCCADGAAGQPLICASCSCCRLTTPCDSACFVQDERQGSPEGRRRREMRSMSLRPPLHSPAGVVAVHAEDSGPASALEVPSNPLPPLFSPPPPCRLFLPKHPALHEQRGPLRPPRLALSTARCQPACMDALTRPRCVLPGAAGSPCNGTKGKTPMCHAHRS